MRYMLEVKRQMGRLGLEIELAAVEELKHHGGGDLLHLTQLHQLDVAEEALDWAAARRMPVVLNPLFEAVLPMWYRWAIEHRWRWRFLDRACGSHWAEAAYVRWHTATRFRDADWRRQREILQRAHVIANTSHELDHLRDWFGLPNLPQTIVPLGIDVELFGDVALADARSLPPLLQQHRGRYILEVGLISRRKNQVGLLLALSQTRDLIVFVGAETPYEPEYCEDVRRLAARRGNVVFLEYVEDRLLPALYGNARVHVLPSWSERPGMVSLEAAACGCGVVSSNRAPIHEYLGHLAWYVDPSYPERIRSVVHQAMESETPAGLRECALSYSWRKTAEKLAAVYLAILSGSIATR